MLSCQVPLAPRALQFRVMGPIDRKDLVAQEFSAIIRSVKGQTNWMQPRERGTILVALVLASTGWGLYLIYGIIWAAFWRANPSKALALRALWMACIAVFLVIPLAVTLKYGIAPPTGLLPASWHPGNYCLLDAGRPALEVQVRASAPWCFVTHGAGPRTFSAKKPLVP